MPGRISTRTGLVAAMEKIRAAADNPSLRALAAAPRTEGRLSRRAVRAQTIAQASLGRCIEWQNSTLASPPS
ncbi:hypothetical protein [Streptomyces sp. NPDC096311]|uniref:hypothetical protein n=1 Tax=Streptomyces sp. NPDC096311 TaxID=3366083 RepID=UPI0037F5F418